MQNSFPLPAGSNLSVQKECDTAGQHDTVLARRDWCSRYGVV